MSWQSLQLVICCHAAQHSARIKINFAKPEIIKHKEHIVGSVWIYDELYCTDKNYEANMPFIGEGMPEVVICCNDILQIVI